MEIKKLLCKKYNEGTVARIKYIVIHYTGSTGDAEANAKFFANSTTQSSAHYIVGYDGAVWQSVEDKNSAWHCGSGGKPYYHDECRNSNSIGIEMCVRCKGSKSADSKDWYFEDATVEATIELTKMLMAKYNIGIDNVVRHYDVTHKICPNPFVYNHTNHTWDAFKSALEYRPSGWVKENDGWYYYDVYAHDMIKNGWHQIDNIWYLFGAEGKMVSNDWYFYKDHWYFLDTDGSMMANEWLLKDGKLYRFDSEGRMITDELNLKATADGDYEILGETPSESR